MDRGAELHQAIVEALAELDGDRTPLDLVQDIPLIESSVEQVIADRVDAARTQGLSWAAIALKLDMSRQAAHKRFGKDRRKRMNIEFRLVKDKTKQ